LRHVERLRTQDISAVLASSSSGANICP
jgi:hypothetical protein